jgi:hypothetical protein
MQTRALRAPTHNMIRPRAIVAHRSTNKHIQPEGRSLRVKRSNKNTSCLGEFFGIPFFVYLVGPPTETNRLTVLNQNPEQRARDIIDAQLAQCGWLVQSYAQKNIAAARGVAIRDYPTDTGPADYLLFVDRKPVGVIEAKRGEEGVRLTTVEDPPTEYGIVKLNYIFVRDWLTLEELFIKRHVQGLYLLARKANYKPYSNNLSLIP